MYVISNILGSKQKWAVNTNWSSNKKYFKKTFDLKRDNIWQYQSKINIRIFNLGAVLPGKLIESEYPLTPFTYKLKVSRMYV